MDKTQLSGSSKDSTLKDLLPSLSNEAVEEMYHSKIKLASDKSMKSTRQRKELERDIDTLAREMKVRNVKIYARTSSRKSKVEPTAERQKATMNVEKEQKQRVKIATTKKVEVTTRPTRKDSVADVASSIYSNARPPSHKNVDSNPLEDDNKKVSFDELIHMKGSRSLKRQHMANFYWLQQNESNSGLERKVNNYFLLKGKELDFVQVDYNLIKEKDDALVQEHLDKCRLNEKKHKLKLEPDDYSQPEEHTGCDFEEENVYTLVVKYAEPPKAAESLCQPPSVSRITDNKFISAAESSGTNEKAENSTNRSEGLVQERVVKKEKLAPPSSKLEKD